MNRRIGEFPYVDDKENYFYLLTYVEVQKIYDTMKRLYDARKLSPDEQRDLANMIEVLPIVPIKESEL